jgi:hypothetical protein
MRRILTALFIVAVTASFAYADGPGRYNFKKKAATGGGAGQGNVFNESFEGTGYELTWTETNNLQTVNEDSAGPGTLPTGGGTQCLNIVKNTDADASAFTSHDYGSAPATTYTRVYVYVSARSIASTANIIVAACSNDSDPINVGATVALQLYNDSGTYRWRWGYHAGGVWTYITSTDTAATGQWYRMEWKIAGTALEFLIDGTSVGTATATLDRGAPRYWHLGSYYGGANTITMYHDLLGVGSTGWIGQ